MKASIGAARRDFLYSTFSALVCIVMTGSSGSRADEALDARVRAFLDEHARDWHDLNVPAQDGRILHDIVVENGFTRAVEIGTSTGHSTIWIAWALSKTGGRLVTVEIDERRHDEAEANVAEAGLSDYVELVLGDAHEVVPALEGPYDFVFSDADKDWYINYFDALYPKLTPNACVTAHNVREGRGGWQAEYLEHVRAVPDMTTRLHPDARAGIAVTCKR
jgi:caffeoyl-CoA O-methyltransferase